MQPHQQRVIDERNQLEERRKKLSDFMEGKQFFGLPEMERNRMRRQLKAMTEYSEVLSERIADFPLEKKTDVEIPND